MLQADGWIKKQKSISHFFRDHKVWPPTTAEAGTGKTRLVKFLCCEEEDGGVLKSFRGKNDEVEEAYCKCEGELKAETEGWQAALSPPSLLFLSIIFFFPTVEQEERTVSHFI